MGPHAELLRWYRKQGRDLPWRTTRDPYRILLSEVMLQQTQVERVITYYQRFLEHYPNEQRLAAAPLSDLHRLWQGLGYPSRIERLQATCRVIIEEHNGIWPTTAEELAKLPGIGPYTSAAVATFAFSQVTPVVDTNIARVYTRRDGLELPRNTAERKALWQHAAIANHHKEPIAYNNALMDLGANICSARQPKCEVCPWAKRCHSIGQKGLIEASGNPLKVASKKTPYSVKPSRKGLKHIAIVLALIHNDGSYLVAKRPQKLRHGGHWELPGGKVEPGENDRVALARELAEETGLELLSARPFVVVYDDQGDRCFNLKVYRCRVHNAEQAQALENDGIQWVTPEQFIHLDFPPANAAIIRRFIDYHRLFA